MWPKCGEQDWRSGENARLPPIVSTNLSRVRFPALGVMSRLSLLVLPSAPRDFSPGTPVFPSPQKPAFDLI